MLVVASYSLSFMPFTLQLAGGSATSSNSRPSQRDHHEVPLLLGGGVPRLNLNDEMLDVALQLNCDVFTEDLVIALIFSRHSLQASAENLHPDGAAFDSVEFGVAKEYMLSCG